MGEGSNQVNQTQGSQVFCVESVKKQLILEVLFSLNVREGVILILLSFIRVHLFSIMANIKPYDKERLFVPFY
jgi:hypothetical protein